MKNHHLSSFFVLALIFMAAPTAFSQDPIEEWNIIAVNTTLTTSPLPPPAAQTRLMAIYSLSVHDAVNGITRKYHTYGSPGSAPVGSSATAAAIAASYRSLCNLYGATRCASLNPTYLQSLADHGVAMDDPGIGYGMAAADGISAMRANDGAASASFAYVPPNSIAGTFILLAGQNALLPGWGAVTPFVLHSGSQFRPDPPPALESDLYARDYNEVKSVGSAANRCTPTVTGLGDCLTEVQAERMRIALFWRDGSPVNVWNQPVRVFAAAQGLDISESARIFALINTAAADSSIACWEAKWGVPNISGGYNWWRPQAAIRRGAEDRNPATEADPNWLPVHTTPAHPEYPSGHTTNSTAMATILELAFGNYPGGPVTSTVTALPAPGNPLTMTRSWNSFQQASDEVIEARIYSGIHFRNTDEVGARLGGQVARFVWTHALRPCRGRRCG